MALPPRTVQEGSDGRAFRRLEDYVKLLDTRLSALAGTPSTPSGPAGGDLSGTYPNPTVPGLATLATSIALKADKSITLTAGTGLTGGGDLSANRSFAADFGTGAGKVTQGNDSRLSDARTPTGTAGGDLTGTYPNPTLSVAPCFYGAYGSRPSAGHAGKLAILNDAPISMWVDTGSAWAPLIGGVLGVEPPLLSSFTSFNLGSAVGTQLNGAIKFQGVNDGGTVTLRGYTVAQTGSNHYAEICINLQPLHDSTNNHYAVAGVCFRNSSSSKAWVMALVQDFTVNTDSMQARTYLESSYWTGNTTRSAATVLSYAVTDSNAPLFLRVEKNPSNLFVFASRDRITWTQLDSITIASSFTPDTCGFTSMGFNTAQLHTITHFSNVVTVP